MKSTASICALLFAIGLANPQPAAAQFSVQPITGGIYIVKFTTGTFNMNNLLVVDPAGVVLVDTLPTLQTLTPPFALYFPFSGIIASITDGRPVDTIINTSWHFDHVGLNDKFRTLGGTEQILAHWRVGSYLDEAHCNPDFPPPADCTPAYPAPESQPTVGIRGGKLLELQNERISLKTVENAHGGADLFVYLETANIVYTGDVYFGGMYPIIDRLGGGTLNGTLASLRKILALIDDDTIVVPSHGALGHRSDLVEFVEMLEWYRWQIRQLIASGYTEEEVMYDPMFAALDEQWANPGVSHIIEGPQFRRILYRDLAPQEGK